jgi:hypothetical protein
VARDTDLVPLNLTRALYAWEQRTMADEGWQTGRARHNRWDSCSSTAAIARADLDCSFAPSMPLMSMSAGTLGSALRQPALVAGQLDEVGRTGVYRADLIGLLIDKTWSSIGLLSGVLALGRAFGPGGAGYATTFRKAAITAAP